MPPDCSPTLFDFAPVQSRTVIANFDGGAITTDAGALLLGATDQALGLTRRLAACFQDRRDPDLIEHRLETLLMQRVTGIALGYEDLNDHDQLRHDPLMAVLAGKLAAKLRPANIDACAGALEEVIRLTGRIRARWPNTRIIDPGPNLRE